ncbi:hypothetical protein BDR05DRAFT_952995 [Suillus weaverae]|nr:hypothetical protein BDR05DRAFT_952995 [Suillus weaverae]
MLVKFRRPSAPFPFGAQKANKTVVVPAERSLSGLVLPRRSAIVWTGYKRKHQRSVVIPARYKRKENESSAAMEGLHDGIGWVPGRLMNRDRLRKKNRKPRPLGRNIGQTCIVFLRDGKIAYTGGLDSLEGCWLSGGHDSDVRRYLPGKAQFNGLVTNAAGASIRCLAVDPSGKRVAVASDFSHPFAASAKANKRPPQREKKIDTPPTQFILARWEKKTTRMTKRQVSSLDSSTSHYIDRDERLWDDALRKPFDTGNGHIDLSNLSLKTIPAPIADLAGFCNTTELSEQSLFFGHSMSRVKTEPALESRARSFERTKSIMDSGKERHMLQLYLFGNSIHDLPPELFKQRSSDGTVVAWNISDTEARVENVIDGIIPEVVDPESPEFMHDCSAVWHPSGQYFFAASRTRENLLAWTDTEGVFTRWRDAIPAGSPDPVRQTAASSVQGTTTKRRPTPPLWGEEPAADAEGGACASTMQNLVKLIAVVVSGGKEERLEDASTVQKNLLKFIVVVSGGKEERLEEGIQRMKFD